jgi:2-polyprenyl-3-methyl-5-hydroxy-6-metoxy-1,4-benzoquinol methylase
MHATPLGTATQSLIDSLLQDWPEHRSFVDKSFASRSPEVLAASEMVSAVILKLAASIDGGVPAMISDYRFVCEEIVLPEEIHFRRNGTYRNSTFAQADAECYANPLVYDRYMNGLLLSDVMWANHAAGFEFFINSYVPMLPQGARHLEIGPGHGLFLYFAAVSGRMGSLAGWDVSPTSIAKTAHALELLGITQPVDLTLQDVMAAADTRDGAGFDSIVISEVLEHLEEPEKALRGARQWLAPGGLIWINVPANSPAPDHIYLFTGPDHLAEMTRAAGFEIVAEAASPMSGTKLERALRQQLSVSCTIVGRNPG